MSTTVSEHPNAALVRRGYEAFNTADLAALTQLFDRNASWYTPGRGPLAGHHLGREATIAHFGRYLEETGGTFKAEVHRVLTDEDGSVIGIHRSVAERDGKKLDVYCCIVFEVDGGRITDGREHFYDLHGWDEFWA